MVYRTPFPTPSTELAAADFRPPPPPLPVMDEDLASLAEGLFEAAIDMTRWTGWLKKLSTLFGSTGAHVALYDFKKGEILLHAMSARDFDWPAEAVRTYEDETPTDARASLCMLYPGRAFTHQDFDPVRVSKEAAIQIAPDDLAQMLVVSDVCDPFWGFYSLLKHKDDPHFTDIERARMASLAPAFNRAMTILRAAQAPTTDLSATLDLIHAMHAPIGLLNDMGVVVGLNKQASSMLGMTQLDSVDGLLQGQAGWSRAWESVQADGTAHMTIVAQGRTVTVRLVRLTGRSDSILLELDVDVNGITMRTDRFCSHYGLSTAERAVIEQLAMGQSVEEIAVGRHTTYETVRAQLRSVREKTGLASQEDIVRELLHFANRLLAVA